MSYMQGWASLVMSVVISQGAEHNLMACGHVYILDVLFSCVGVKYSDLISCSHSFELILDLNPGSTALKNFMSFSTFQISKTLHLTTHQLLCNP